jgi:phosphatidylinositol glycan class C protein
MVWLSITLFPPSKWILVGPMLVPSGATLVFAVVLLIVNLGGPLMLWWGWSWKSRRDGNWDVAVVRLRKRNRQ